MPSFRYRALNGSGQLVTGAVVAQSRREVSDHMEQLGLILIDDVAVDRPAASPSWQLAFSKPTYASVTIFTRDLALLLRAGGRINDVLDLLASDRDIGRMKPVVAEVRTRVLSGESFADALGRYPEQFSSMYIALVRVGEASGSLDTILEVLAGERERADVVRRKLNDAIRYPLFILSAAGGVLVFFLFFVLPQFAGVLQDFNAKVDPFIGAFLALSSFLRANLDGVLMGGLIALMAGWLLLRQPAVRQAIRRTASRPPMIRHLLEQHRTAIFCRNLGVLLSSGVNLTLTLRILVDMMGSTGDATQWRAAAERVRHGAKLPDALADTVGLPPMAARMLRLGDETGQLPMLAGRVAEFYEQKLQRSLDRVVGIAGPAAIIVISIIVGGLIVSIMTALMSVSQIVG
jgi:general secretion pathway protein F